MSSWLGGNYCEPGEFPSSPPSTGWVPVSIPPVYPADVDAKIAAQNIVDNGTFASITSAIKGWATGSAFLLTGSQVYDATYGTLTGATIAWPDGATGVFASTGIDTTSSNPGGLTGFTATHVAAGTTLTATVVIPRNSSGQVSGAMTATVA